MDGWMDRCMQRIPKTSPAFLINSCLCYSLLSFFVVILCCCCCCCHVVLQNYPTDLLWDLVALKDLEPGEKLIVALERDSTTGQWLIPNELVPNKWRIITPPE
jgi:hypothetical protein